MQAAVTASQLRVPPSARPNGVGWLGVQPGERMTGVAVQAERRAGVLDRAVGVQQQRRHGADLGAQRLLEQRLDPLRIDDLGVVVEEHQHVGLRASGRRRC